LEEDLAELPDITVDAGSQEMVEKISQLKEAEQMLFIGRIYTLLQSGLRRRQSKG
jgi:hypothetical protein